MEYNYNNYNYNYNNNPNLFVTCEGFPSYTYTQTSNFPVFGFNSQVDYNLAQTKLLEIVNHQELQYSFEDLCETEEEPKPTNEAIQNNQPFSLPPLLFDTQDMIESPCTSSSISTSTSFSSLAELEDQSQEDEEEEYSSFSVEDLSTDDSLASQDDILMDPYFDPIDNNQVPSPVMTQNIGSCEDTEDEEDKIQKKLRTRNGRRKKAVTGESIRLKLNEKKMDPQVKRQKLNEAVRMREKGLTFNDVSKKIQLSLSTVKRTWYKYVKYQDTSDRRKRNGRRRLLSSESMEQIKYNILINPKITAEELQVLLNLKVSIRSVRRARKSLGFKLVKGKGWRLC